MNTHGSFTRRGTMRAGTVGLLALLLAGCAGVVPKSEAPPPPPEQPRAGQLPDQDESRHRIALLVPLSGANAGVGQSLANATTMALLDTNTANIRITTYDSATNAKSAAQRAIADGNRLILGPLLSDDVAAVKAVAGPARVPMISFSNDATVAGDGVYVMGQVPAQSLERSLRYASSQGLKTFGALVPSGEYGRSASEAIMDTARETGIRVMAIESYDRDATSLANAIKRLAAKGDYQAIVIADGSRMAVRAGPLIRDAEKAAKIIGTELWSGDEQIAQSASLRGAWFSALSDGRFKRYSDSYKTRFGASPYRISTLGYDAVLLTIKIARDWRVGDRFPTTPLADAGGFIGLDGAFRFDKGVVERAFEVREVTSTGVKVLAPAPAKF
ncbi:penicillin-binding protein activator [Croceicoccus ponticola]|uniref:Penicillin-binding protein activator n=1 Tax=Croceicoccus ponticola TaxID=2217664 RepID=A0A437H0R9_9SPHN|nr:penicillin-binding protein activator [Croceicoccus ponticola]RVQ69102.1 penicillin-binding protein activator [Croceicoccus ponticola]